MMPWDFRVLSSWITSSNSSNLVHSFFSIMLKSGWKKKRNPQVSAWCIFINCPQNDAMILAGNVGSQGGIQNGYMYAILFGAVSAVRSSLLKPTLFLWATKGNIVKIRHCVMSECWMLQSWMSDVICWNSEPMIDKLWALEDVKFRSLNILCCAGHCWARTTHIWWQGSEWSWGQVSRPACTWRYPFFGSGLNLSSSHTQVSPETRGSHRLCWSK